MKITKARWILIACLLLPFMLHAKVLKLNRVAVVPQQGNTQLVFQLTGPFLYHINTYHGTAYLTIDFRGTELATALNKIKLSSTLVKSIHAHQLASHTLQVILDLHQKIIPQAHILKPRGRFGYRLLLDLQPINKKQPAPVVAIRKTPTKSVIQPPQNTGRNAIVVLDPGHGGKDPGATGPNGIHEKNIVLAIGKDLDAILKKAPHITPKMTRSGDYFVTLRGRLQLARKGQADLFMAIHADAFINSDAHGASVFALSERGASSEAARWLAQKENYSELGGVDLSDKSYQLRSVLLDLSQNATIRESLIFGNSVVRAFHAVHVRLHRGFVEQARFVVLKSPDIPSLLIETGFISNRQEEHRLNDPAYQERMARALASGIEHYLENNPPPGTWFALKKTGMIHVVKPGETLYQISQRYHISISELKALNHLKSDVLSAGQKLHVS